MAAITYWVNRDEPYLVLSSQVASSGKIAVVRNPVSGDKGKMMKVVFRMASSSELDTWKGYTSTFSMFGKTVIWAPDGLQYQHEVFAESDVNSPGAINYYRGTMTLIIVQ